MRNLQYPLSLGWRHLRLRQLSGLSQTSRDEGGWKDVYKVDNPAELFAAYDQSRDLCMTLQAAVKFQEYFRCYVVRSGARSHHAL